MLELNGQMKLIHKVVSSGLLYAFVIFHEPKFQIFSSFTHSKPKKINK